MIGLRSACPRLRQGGRRIAPLPILDRIGCARRGVGRAQDMCGPEGRYPCPKPGVGPDCTNIDLNDIAWLVSDFHQTPSKVKIASLSAPSGHVDVPTPRSCPGSAPNKEESTMSSDQLWADVENWGREPVLSEL